MASVNSVQILGNLGRDPEVRYLPSGDAVANITVATTDRYKDKQTGENKEITEWHRINFFGRQAEVVGQYLRKGSQVFVQGSLRTRKWTDKDGQEKYSTEIRAENLQILGPKPENGNGSSNGNGESRSGGNNRGGDNRGNAPQQRNNMPANRQPQSAQQPTNNGDDEGGWSDSVPF